MRFYTDKITLKKESRKKAEFYPKICICHSYTRSKSAKKGRSYTRSQFSKYYPPPGRLESAKKGKQYKKHEFRFFCTILCKLRDFATRYYFFLLLEKFLLNFLVGKSICWFNSTNSSATTNLKQRLGNFLQLFYYFWLLVVTKMHNSTASYAIPIQTDSIPIQLLPMDDRTFVFNQIVNYIPREFCVKMFLWKIGQEINGDNIYAVTGNKVLEICRKKHFFSKKSFLNF